MDVNQDELTLLRKVRDDVAEPSTTAIIAGRAALLDAAAPRAAQATRKRRALRRAGWTSLGVVGAAGIAAALVLTNIVGLAGWRGGADPAAADTLTSAAVAAIHNADPVVGPGQYLKIETNAVGIVQTSTVDQPGRFISYELASTDQLYVPADKNDDWVWVRPASTVYKTFGAESAQLARNQVEQQTKEFPNGDGTLRAAAGGFYGSPAVVSPTALAALPRDPHQLLNQIYRMTLGAGSGPDSEAFVYIADTLRSGIVPADLRAALYRAAALIPGVSITEKQANLDGRIGVAIGIADGPVTRQDIVIDPSTGLMIGERSVYLKAADGLPAGTVAGFTAIRTSVVDSAPAGGTLCGDVNVCSGSAGK